MYSKELFVDESSLEFPVQFSYVATCLVSADNVYDMHFTLIFLTQSKSSTYTIDKSKEGTDPRTRPSKADLISSSIFTIDGKVIVLVIFQVKHKSVKGKQQFFKSTGANPKLTSVLATYVSCSSARPQGLY